ncbi:hypothetical protein CVT26_007835 [Gymnopilus dilepis]|uniref:Uncharacterized protein n=1 Tax=Gymnopilus dilepis TaxID=231916 RepID=A0A409WEP8_9AGAR|nr:hypothetical protein CVT26_007835 [Gymnopilus dilepis]
MSTAVSATNSPVASGTCPDLDNDQNTELNLVEDIFKYYADRPAIQDTCESQFGRDDDRQIRHDALDCPVKWKASLKYLTKPERRAKLRLAMRNLGYCSDTGSDTGSDTENAADKELARIERISAAMELLGYTSTSEEDSESDSDDMPASDGDVEGSDAGCPRTQEINESSASSFSASHDQIDLYGHDSN